MADSAAQPTIADLLALVGELRERVAALAAENARLRAEVAALRGEGAPPRSGATPGELGTPARKRPAWVKAHVIVVARHRTRRPRTPVPGRRREVPDRIVVHAPTVCPECAAPLARGRLVGRRQVIALPPVRAEVVEHQVRERTCRRCGRRCRGTMPDLGEQVGTHRRVSWAVTAWVATLRTKLRLPLAQLRWLLAQGWGLRLSVGEVSALLAEAARAGQPAYEALLGEARASPVVHLDETGWRENGRNGWVWTVTTATSRLFHYSRSRAGAVARRLLGEAGTATVVSDFYGAYDQLERSQQRCWAHLLRAIHDLGTAHPGHAAVTTWAAGVRDVYDRALAWAAAATTAGMPPILRERARDRFEAELVALCQAPSADVPQADVPQADVPQADVPQADVPQADVPQADVPQADVPQAVLCARIVRYRRDLFTFVADPAVPPTNNAAERALRPLVIARKISGGTRSDQGTTTRMVLHSLVATWELRGLDPVAEFLALLRAPRPALALAPV